MEAGRELDALLAEKAMGWELRYAWSPSTKIDDAFELVAKHPYYFSLVHSRDGDLRAPLLWHCRFMAPQQFQVAAETPTLAIALAALRYCEIHGAPLGPQSWDKRDEVDNDR